MENVKYLRPSRELWTGRKVIPETDIQYYYQAMGIVDIEQDGIPDSLDFAILGYSCDEGVRRNHGRVGTSAAPDLIKSNLGRLAWHNTCRIADIGNVVCIEENLEVCQNMMSSLIEEVVSKDIITIGIGGGHDIAYAHCGGLINAFPNDRIGIINIDAHFDLRPVQLRANSGTPFYQLLSQEEGVISYMAVGIQQTSNTRQLFSIAEDLGVQYILNDDCHSSRMALIEKQMEAFFDNCDKIYLSIDMDGFSSSYAPGVSAPSPLGLRPEFVWSLVKYIMSRKKVIGVDIAEVNPRYDIDGITVQLAALLIDHIVRTVEEYPMPS